MQAMADLGSADLLFQTEMDSGKHPAEGSAKEGDTGLLSHSQLSAFVGIVLLFLLMAFLLNNRKDGNEDDSAQPVEWKFDERGSCCLARTDHSDVEAQENGV